ncbi:MAG: Asp23/Gls24 family envelope stress response protein [Actinomycetota bacterium]|nr:Asp23/Gls24 family envelope stress response protein [Actinomycetota bacterium]
MADITTTTPPGTSGTSDSSGTAGGLVTERGKTSIADSVVAKIAGIATREISGVHNMGSGAARTMGAIKEKISSGKSAASQGVNVEVGERQAAVDLDIVVEYGVPIVDLSKAVRDNVTQRIERMTGLEVTEVNVYVDDIFLEQEQPEPAPERVQ